MIFSIEPIEPIVSIDPMWSACRGEIRQPIPPVSGGVYPQIWNAKASEPEKQFFWP
jgi:hypothetical protein